jgi:hypothetical protein
MVTKPCARSYKHLGKARQISGQRLTPAARSTLRDRVRKRKGEKIDEKADLKHRLLNVRSSLNRRAFTKATVTSALRQADGLNFTRRAYTGKRKNVN